MMQIYNTIITPFSELEKDVKKNYPGYEIHVDKKLRLTNDRVEELRDGLKPVAIRTYDGKVRIPLLDRWRLPVYETTPDNLEDEGMFVGYIYIPKVL